MRTRASWLGLMIASALGCRSSPAPAPAPAVQPHAGALSLAIARSACSAELGMPVQLGCDWLTRLPAGFEPVEREKDRWTARLEDCTSALVEVELHTTQPPRRPSRHSARAALEDEAARLEAALGPLERVSATQSNVSPLAWLRPAEGSRDDAYLVAVHQGAGPILTATYHVRGDADATVVALVEASARSAVHIAVAYDEVEGLPPGTPLAQRCRPAAGAGPTTHWVAVGVVAAAAAELAFDTVSSLAAP